MGLEPSEARADLIGVDAVGLPGSAPESSEVRLRVAARFASAEAAAQVGLEVEALYTNGPAGGGGAARSVTRVLGVASAFVPRSAAQPRVRIEVVP